MFRQPRFVSRRRILMNYSLVDRFIDQRDRRIQEFDALRLIMTRNRRSQFLDLRPQFAAVISVDLFAPRILPDAFLC